MLNKYSFSNVTVAFLSLEYKSCIWFSLVLNCLLKKKKKLYYFYFIRQFHDINYYVIDIIKRLNTFI